MKLLLDQGLPRSAAPILREAGIDVVHVGEIGLAAAADEALIQYAREAGLCIVTLDADFHSSIAVSGAATPSVIRLRVQGLKGPAAARLIRTVLERIGPELSSGAFMTVTEELIRIRRLPIR
jgi:predicted nuclease of predicted toxin-antitoxin system